MCVCLALGYPCIVWCLQTYLCSECPELLCPTSTQTSRWVVFVKSWQSRFFPQPLHIESWQCLKSSNILKSAARRWVYTLFPVLIMLLVTGPRKLFLGRADWRDFKVECLPIPAAVRPTEIILLFFSGHAALKSLRSQSQIQQVCQHGWWRVVLTALGTLERGDWWNTRGHVGLFMRFAAAGCVLTDCMWPFLSGWVGFGKGRKTWWQVDSEDGQSGCMLGHRCRGEHGRLTSPVAQGLGIRGDPGVTYLQSNLSVCL